MYIVTGGAGFIGSAMVWQLNQLGITDILVVDHLASSEKWKNLVPLKYRDYIDRDEFASKIRNRSIGQLRSLPNMKKLPSSTLGSTIFPIAIIISSGSSFRDQ